MYNINNSPEKTRGAIEMDGERLLLMKEWWFARRFKIDVSKKLLIDIALEDVQSFWSSSLSTSILSEYEYYIKVYSIDNLI